MLTPGGVLAVQMPRNFDNPSQTLLRETAASGAWAAMLAPLFAPDIETPSLLRPDPVGTPDFYYDLLAPPRETASTFGRPNTSINCKATTRCSNGCAARPCGRSSMR